MSHIELHLLTPNNANLLDRVAPGVFDGPVLPQYAKEFIADPRHHMDVAVKDGEVVGMASALHYVHPDKPPAFWINEVGVDDAHQKQGIGRRLVQRLLEHGRSIGCTESWVATEMDNTAARRLYVTCGGREDKDDAVVYWFPME
jgi:aminoglycoside 6'-N-acetyltransferase I